jgi:hypothetical protein
VGRGQTVILRVNAAPRGGFAAPIDVRLDGVPPGVTATPLVLMPGETSGVITVTAAPDAPTASKPLRVIGQSAVEGSPGLSRVAAPVASLPRPGEGALAPRRVEFQSISITDETPLFTLATDPSQVELTPGQTVTVKVKAGRKAGDNNATGDIALALANLPAGVTAEAKAVPEKMAEATIKITAAADARPAKRYALLTGKIGENPEQPAPGLLVIVKPK